MNDNDLEMLLRSSGPATTSVDEPLTVRQRAILDRIVAETHDVRPARRRLTWLVATPVAAAMAVLAVMAVSVLHPFGASPAAAWGPSPLVYTTSTSTLEETVAMASDRARSSMTPRTAVRSAVSTSWNLTVDDGGTAQRVVAIVPSVSDLTWSADLSGRLVTTVGEPYRADGGSGPAEGDDLPVPGSVLDDRTYSPGEYPALVPDMRDLDASGFELLLSAVVQNPSLPGDALPLVQGLLSEWTLTGAQHAELLEALMGYEDLRLLGTTTDRLGREVVGVAAPSSQEREATFLVSVDSGRIVGVEHTVVGSDDPLGVPAGTVISYTMWKDL